MQILDFILIVLCADAITTAWFYGSIFDTARDYFMRKKEQNGGWLADLMTCGLCLSYHISFWTATLLWLPGQFLIEPWSTVSRLPLCGFAAATVVHYLQQIRPWTFAPENTSNDDTDKSSTADSR